MKAYRLLAASGLLSALTACATPEALKGEFPEITPTTAVTSIEVQPVGTKVRWGGPILSLDNQSNKTCFEVLALPLDVQGKPRETDKSEGRFLACKSGFTEPEVYKPGRLLTIVGTVSAIEKRKVGEHEYTYPSLAADTVYLWPKEPEPSAYPYFYYDPFFGPYPWPYYYPYSYRYVAPPPPRPVAPVPRSSVNIQAVPKVGIGVGVRLGR
jgi:outer membrane lipoprotein